MKRSFPNESKIFLMLLFFLLLISILGQYSAFGGLWDEQVLRHIVRIFIGIALATCIFFIDFRFWNNYAYMFYAFALISLLIANLAGITRLGAQRWIDLYFFAFQPSEFMKLATIFALARYYSILSSAETMRLKDHISPIFFVLLPALLIFKQPDLGTAVLIVCTGAGIIFLAGFPQKAFAAIIGLCFLLCPVGWFFLHDYQKNRILTFVDPYRDPLGAGYHILQSKIAIGSGRLWGRGFLHGTQSKLNFLPEKNTDFIFTTIAEEFGFAGSIAVLFLFIFICYYFFWAASVSRNKFTKLLCYGLGMLLFLHVFVNVAMVVGLLPVVGVPLPFLSYGGSSMTTFMISCGLLMSSFKQKRF